MANKYGIPEDEEARIRARDLACVYCRKEMIPWTRSNQMDSATIEHLSPRRPFYWSEGMTADNIVICCGACNSSRSSHDLHDWFQTRYCLERGICASSVSEPVKAYLDSLTNATFQ